MNDMLLCCGHDYEVPSAVKSHDGATVCSCTASASGSEEKGDHDNAGVILSVDSGNCLSSESACASDSWSSSQSVILNNVMFCCDGSSAPSTTVVGDRATCVCNNNDFGNSQSAGSDIISTIASGNCLAGSDCADASWSSSQTLKSDGEFFCCPSGHSAPSTVDNHGVLTCMCNVEPEKGDHDNGENALGVESGNCSTGAACASASWSDFATVINGGSIFCCPHYYNGPTIDKSHAKTKCACTGSLRPEYVDVSKNKTETKRPDQYTEKDIDNSSEWGALAEENKDDNEEAKIGKNSSKKNAAKNDKTVVDKDSSEKDTAI